MMEWPHGGDKGRSMDVTCLDFYKAFNKVPHNILLSNWREMGFMDGQFGG